MGDRHEFSDHLSFLFLTTLGKFEPVPYFSLPSPTDAHRPYQWSCLKAKVLIYKRIRKESFDEDSE